MNECRKLVLRDATIRRSAAYAVAALPLEPVSEVVIRPHKAKRTTDQNDRLHAMLRDLASQVDWHGEKLDIENWKALFTASLCGQKVVPSLDGGGFTVLSRHTSRMSIAECSDLMELISAWGVEHGVKFSAP